MPVLWRPYHEMNGGWFWWGTKRGPRGYAALYRTLFERLSEFHQLNNLLWVYNANELNENVDPYADLYPGHDVVDVLATDVYRRGFSQDDDDALSALGAGKPIALGEVGSAPSPELLARRPRWTWFMVWNDTSTLATEALSGLVSSYRSERTLALGDLPWNERRTARMHYPVIE